MHLLIAPSRAVSVDFAVFLEDALPGLATNAGTQIAVREAAHLRQIWITGGTDRRWARGGFHRFGEDVVPQEILSAVEAGCAQPIRR